MAAQKKPNQRFEVDEILVQIVVREIDSKGETVAKHRAEPVGFVNERAFREWAAQPFQINQRDDATA